MMNCPKCGNAVQEGIGFCPFCGHDFGSVDKTKTQIQTKPKETKNNSTSIFKKFMSFLLTFIMLIICPLGILFFTIAAVDGSSKNIEEAENVFQQLAIMSGNNMNALGWIGGGLFLCFVVLLWALAIYSGSLSGKIDKISKELEQLQEKIDVKG